MRKIWGLLAAVVLLASLPGPTALAVGSASVSISNYTKVQQGKSYSYTISVRVASSMDFIGTIKFSGVFSHDPIYLDYHPSSNSSTTLVKRVTFRIPSNAALGSQGAITVTGQGDYLDAGGNPVEYNVSKSLTAKVIAPVASTPRPTSAATKKPTSSPSPSPTPKATATATATPGSGEWDAAIQSAASMQTGGTLNIAVAQSPQIPAALLGTLKGKQGKLTVDLGNCTCLIDGQTLANIPASGTVDLAMTTEKDAVLTAAAGGADLYQLHFAKAGQLPGKFIYTFRASLNKPGDKLYLYYYYDVPGVLEGVQSSAVDSGGNVSFQIYHCSSYAVSDKILEGAMGSFTAEAQPAPTNAQAELDGLKQQLDAEHNNTLKMESQFKEAQDAAAMLKERLKNAESSSTAITAHSSDTLNIPYVVLAGAVLIVVLLTSIFTMLLCRSGLFRKKRRVRKYEN